MMTEIKNKEKHADGWKKPNTTIEGINAYILVIMVNVNRLNITIKR